MISKMEITGKIKEILELKEFDSGFRKREFVVTTQEQYPQDILLEFTKDKCDLLDNLNQDDEVNVCFNKSYEVL